MWSATRSAKVVSSVILTDTGTGYNRFDILTVGATDLGKANPSTKPDLKVRVDHVGFAEENIVLNVANSDNITVNDLRRVIENESTLKASRLRRQRPLLGLMGFL